MKGTVQQAVALTEATARFVVCSNVLAGIAGFDRGGRLFKPPHLQAARTTLDPALARRNARPELTKQESRLLHIAWQTELSARVSDVYDDDMLRRVAAQTLPVQAYYAVFNAARAMTTAAGTACDTHQAVHRDFQSQRARRAFGSWNITLKGDPEDVSKCVLSPAIAVPTAFNPMELSHPTEEYVWAALRMARRWKIESLRADWLRKGRTKTGQPRKRLPSNERAQLVASLRPTTLMDFLYELRRRTNYEGVDEYGSDAEDRVVEQFHRGLLHMADMGLLHYEAWLVERTGIAALELEVREWTAVAKKVGRWATEAVERRLSAFKAVV